MRKIKTVIVENGFEKEVEIEIPDGPPATWGNPKQHRILGKRNPRPDGALKVSGRAKYSADIVLPGMCYGRFLMSKHASATITALDVSAAQRMPGVKAIHPIVQAGGTVNFAGQPLVAVAAITPEIAEDAIRAIKVTYQVRPHVVNLDKAMQPGAPLVRPEAAGNLFGPGQRTEGDVAGAFQKAAAVVESTYLAQTRLHCCLETHGNVVKIDGDKVTVWASTQFVEGVRDYFAGQAQTDKKNVQVICEHMGGGFGSKFAPQLEGVAVYQLAKMAKAPVKLMLNRAEEQYANYRGPGVKCRVRLAGAADGVILGADVEAWNDGGPVGASTPMNQGFYVVQPKALKVASRSVLTHTGGTAALRAPGHPQAAAVWDQALDLLAAKLNLDPIELRKKNHSDPVRVAEWDLGAKIIGWDRRQKTPGSAPGVRKRGMGMGSATWGGGGRKTADVTVHVARDGKVKVFSGIQDLGTGARLYVNAIVAEELGLELADVEPLIGYSDYGRGHASGGSTTTASVAPTVKIAATYAREQLAQVAAKALGVKSEDLEVGVGGVFKSKSQPGKSMGWKQLCASLPPDGLRVRGDWDAGSDLQTGGVAGCTFAEVEVDTETGKVTVLKVVGVQDCGLILNRLQAENQVTGGIIQGIGTALLEERRMDNLTGRMLNPNFEEYKLCGSFESGGVNITMDPPYRTLGANETGVVTVLFESGTGKVSGIGEPAIIGVQSAIANAIYNAIGVQITELPATPDRVLAALARKNGASA